MTERLERDNLEGLFPPKPFYDSIRQNKILEQANQQSFQQIPSFSQTSCSWSIMTVGTSLNIHKVLARVSNLLKKSQNKPLKKTNKKSWVKSSMRKPDLSVKTWGGWGESSGAVHWSFPCHGMNSSQIFGKVKPTCPLHPCLQNWDDKSNTNTQFVKYLKIQRQSVIPGIKYNANHKIFAMITSS